VVKFTWVDAPKWLAAMLGIGLGWAGVALLPQLAARLDPAAVALLGVGGLAHTAGAIDLREPPAEPSPGRVRLPRALPRADDRRGRQYVAIAFFVIGAG
jgi:hypothetical protein